MSERPRLTVVLPAYDEEALLESTARGLLAALEQLLPNSHQVVLVDDGSCDRTPEIADRLEAELDALEVVHQANTGIGGALQAGIARAEGEYLLLWPADMPCAAADLQPYLEHMGAADVIVGRRRARPGYTPLMKAASWVYPKLVGLLFGLHLHDVNWICLYRTRHLERLRLSQQGIPMLTEILVKIRDDGGTFLEIPVDPRARQTGVASAGRLGVRIRTLTGLVQLWRDWRQEVR